MKVAHLILAHKNPKQLERLLNALEHPSFDLFVHIDKKTDARQFDYLFSKKNIYPIENRTPIYWGGWGTIQATINGFQQILKQDHDYINVISAQDFPIHSAEYIYQYIYDRRSTEFTTCESIKDKWKEAAPRFHDYSFINWKFRGKHRLEKIANKILPVRKFPLDHEIVGRANWFTLTREACTYLLDFLEKHPEVVRYYKYCWGADEFIFSTALYNSPFREKIVDNLVYVDWSEKKAHPKVLKAEDFYQIIASDKLFARKLDMDVDAELVSLLEEYIAKEKKQLQKI